MESFEDAWSVKGKTYFRVNEDNEVKRKLTPYKGEYYLEDPMGEYKGFMDN